MILGDVNFLTANKILKQTGSRYKYQSMFSFVYRILVSQGHSGYKVIKLVEIYCEPRYD